MELVESLIVSYESVRRPRQTLIVSRFSAGGIGRKRGKMVGDEDKKSRRWLLPSMADYREGVASSPPFFFNVKMCAATDKSGAQSLGEIGGWGAVCHYSLPLIQITAPGGFSQLSRLLSSRDGR